MRTTGAKKLEGLSIFHFQVNRNDFDDRKLEWALCFALDRRQVSVNGSERQVQVGQVEHTEQTFARCRVSALVTLHELQHYTRPC